MDELERLIATFGACGRPAGAAWKLDVLMDVGRFGGPRVVAFYAAVVADATEAPEVRSDALRRLRETLLTPDERTVAVAVCLDALAPESDLTLRLHAALALGDFVDVPAALAALGRLAADVDEPIDLRYNAFTSLQRAGPTPACLEILARLVSDPMLGQSASRLLAVWGGR